MQLVLAVAVVAADIAAGVEAVTVEGVVTVEAAVAAMVGEAGGTGEADDRFAKATRLNYQVSCIRNPITLMHL